jgi:hypothetical protein
MGEKRRVAQTPERLADVRVEIGKRLDCKSWSDPGRLLKLATKPVIGDGEHSAVGVLNEDDVLGPEAALRDGKRANHVITDDSAGVADDVGLTEIQTKRSEDVKARVHAGDNREMPRRADVEVPNREVLGETIVVA